MQLLDQAGVQVCDPEFSSKVKEISRADLDRCYQCQTCTLGCPTAFAMDVWPHQLMRMLHLGLQQRVLSSTAIWLCAACETCHARCPYGVDVPRVMDTLRHMALAQGINSKEGSIPVFHYTFLGGVSRWGRQYELGLVLSLKWRLRDFFSDIGLGVKMLLRGKFKLLPPKGSTEIKAIFDTIEGEEHGR